jgi:hypothetical protein
MITFILLAVGVLVVVGVVIMASRVLAESRKGQSDDAAVTAQREPRARATRARASGGDD